MSKDKIDNSDLTTWSLAELIAGRDLARMFGWWEHAAKIGAELKRRGFTA